MIVLKKRLKKKVYKKPKIKVDVLKASLFTKGNFIDELNSFNFFIDKRKFLATEGLPTY